MSTEIESLANSLNVSGKVNQILESRGTEVSDNKVIALDLSGLNLSDLPDGVFDGLSDLKRLNLGYNKLSNVNPATFAKLSNLTFLSFFANQITELPDDFLKAFPGLEWLDLRENGLTKVPKSILDLKKLVYLYLQNNPDLNTDEYNFNEDYHSKRDVGKFVEAFQKAMGIAPAEPETKKPTKKATKKSTAKAAEPAVEEKSEE